jgi:hypothetical protein
VIREKGVFPGSSGYPDLIRGDEGTFEEPVREAGASTAKLCEACGAGGDLKYHDSLKN